MSPPTPAGSPQDGWSALAAVIPFFTATSPELDDLRERVTAVAAHVSPASRSSSLPSRTEGYKQPQELRRLERCAPELKRHESAGIELGDTPTARKVRAGILANSAAIRRHTEATGQDRGRTREPL